MRWVLALLVVGCGTQEVDPLQSAWESVYQVSPAPYVEWVTPDCGDNGMSVRNEAARTTYCLNGQALNENHVQVALPPGASLRDVAGRVAHELAHVLIMRTRDWDGDVHHTGPEWEKNNPGSLEARGREFLTRP